MYCTKCGKQNDDSVKFCTSCGSALQQGAQSNSMADVKSKISESINKLTQKQKTIIVAAAAVILIVLLIIIISPSCSSGASSPEALAKKYVAAVNSDRAENIEDCYLPQMLSFTYKDLNTNKLDKVLDELDAYYYKYNNASIENYTIDIDYDYNISVVDFEKLDVDPSETACITLEYKDNYHAYSIYLFSCEVNGKWSILYVDAYRH